MRVLALLILLVNAGSTMADAGSPCERVEYAQLKDSSRKELADMYCLATAKAELNKKLRAISHELFESKLALGASTSTVQREMVAQGNAQVSCLKAAESATAMLSKKFNAKPPTSCK